MTVGCVKRRFIRFFALFYCVAIIDDGSTDTSGDICRKYAQTDSRVRYFYQQNSGVSAARNKGLEQAHGEYISFVDSDDFLEPNALEILYKAINAGQYDLACASYQRVYADGSISLQKLLDSVIESPAKLAKICYEINFNVILGGIWGKLYRSEMIKKHKIIAIQ